MEITITKTAAPKAKPADSSLAFGNVFTDHMFQVDYAKEQGWHNARVIPYGPIALDPSLMVLHYAQSSFEGLKAYRSNSGEILFFRPWDNARRLNSSNERLCMPYIKEEDFVAALKAVVGTDRDWVPNSPGTSLYIRPFVFATDHHVGVRPSDTYAFVIILSPVGSYYKEGLAPVKIYVEDEYVRAVQGGLGFTKASANYAASIKAQEKAKKLGYAQVLWLDGIHRKYVEEVGTMNVFFVIDNEIITPELNRSILPGITRDSVLKLLKTWDGYKVSERQISIDEIVAASKNGTLQEAFGTGTAAVISPIGELMYNNEHMIINGGQTGKIAKKLYDDIVGIQTGAIEDKFGWIEKLD